MLGTRTVQHSYLDYDSKGDIIGMNLEGLASSFTWEYDPTSGLDVYKRQPTMTILRDGSSPTTTSDK